MKVRFGIYLLLMVVGSFFSCSDHTDDEGEDGGNKCKVVGSVQKGPFIKGAQITVFALNKDLLATGESYPSQISDDLGAFSISSLMKADYIELRVNGYYYNENRRTVSEAPLSLQAVASADREKVNVNLLTTLSYLRIKKLVADGLNFDASVKKAEAEVLEALGMRVGDVSGVEFSEMDICGERKADAILLAMSCLLQEGRTTGELSSLISDIASELAANGTLSSSLKEKIHKNERYIDLLSIIKGLFDFYEEKQIVDYKIPPFYRYLDLDGDGQIGEDTAFKMLEDQIVPSQGLPAEGYTGEYKVLSSTGFTVKADCDWIKVDKKILSSDIYTVNYKVEENTGKVREGNILFKDPSGTILMTIKIKQISFDQRLYLKLPNTRSMNNVSSSGELKAGEDILINGVGYKVEYDETLDRLYVDLPKADSYSVCYPAGLVSSCDDIYSCTVEYLSEVSGQLQTPYYGALSSPYMIYEIPNPAEVQLQICSAAVSMSFSSKYADNLGYIIVEGNTNSLLAGKATYLIYSDAPYFDPNYVPLDPILANKRNSMKVNIPEGALSCSFLVYPQTATLKITLYNKQGQLVRVDDGTESNYQKGNLYSTHWF